MLQRLFDGETADTLRQWMVSLVNEVRAGKLDDELVYRKSLRRPAEEYQHGETPALRAARLSGWTKQRGAIEFMMTKVGAEPLGLVQHELDYQHYVEHQLRPIWNSLTDAVGMASSDPFSTQMNFLDESFML